MPAQPNPRMVTKRSRLSQGCSRVSMATAAGASCPALTRAAQGSGSCDAWFTSLRLFRTPRRGGKRFSPPFGGRGHTLMRLRARVVDWGHGGEGSGVAVWGRSLGRTSRTSRGRVGRVGRVGKCGNAGRIRLGFIEPPVGLLPPDSSDTSDSSDSRPPIKAPEDPPLQEMEQAPWEKCPQRPRRRHRHPG